MSAPEAPALRCRGLEVRYGDRVALQGIDLEVARGEFLALTGPNGSGKSTLLRAVLGLTDPSGGSVELFGAPAETLSALARARRVSWVPQAEAIREDVPLLRYVLYGRYSAHGLLGRETEEDAAIARAALGEVGLADRPEDGVLTLSGGERQRAVLARALSQRAPLLLLDEPTSQLDIGHQLDLLARVGRLARERGLTVVAALHDLNLAARYAARLVVLSRGRAVADGPPATVLSSRLMARVWGVEAELRRDPASGLPYLLPRLFPALPSTPTGTRVHVVAGGGSGASLLRRLVDAGYDVSAGVLPLFDTDEATAQELGVATAVELPFAPIGAEALERLDRLLRDARAIVVAAFPVGPTNVANLEHLARSGTVAPVLLLRQSPGTPWDYAGGRGSAARSALLDRGAVEVDDGDAALAWLAARRGAGAVAADRGAQGDDLDPERPGGVEQREQPGGVPVKDDDRRRDP